MSAVGTPKEKLKNLIIEKALKFGDFTLASGKKSNYYINCKMITLDPEGLFIVSSLLLDIIADRFPEAKAIGGPTLGADPIVGGVVGLSYTRNHPLKGFIIRKEPKKHGTGQWIEGIEALPKGEKVILVEDVVTTGGTSLKSWNKTVEAGLEPLAILAIVDREEGAEAAFAGQGIPFSPLFRISEFLREKP